MSNIILAHGGLSDSGRIVSSSTTAAAMPATNLQRRDLSVPARFLGGAGFVEIDLGDGATADLVALIGVAVNAGTARVMAHNGGAAVYDSGAIPLIEGQRIDRNGFYHAIPSPVQARFWRIEFEAEATFIDIGRLYVARSFVPAVNMDYGASQGITDTSERRYTKAGRLETTKKPKRRTASFSLTFGSYDEMYGAAYDLDALTGVTEDVLFITDYDDKNYLQKRTIYGTMTELAPIINNYYSLYEKQYRIEELIA